jgi:transcriptional regulator with XRE-family HTH domain
MQRFSEWLSARLSERNLSQAELARRAGVTQATISLVLSENRNPGTEFCEKVARALRMPPEEVFRAAGLLPARADTNPLDERIRYLISTLPTQEDKEDVLAYIEMRTRIAEQRKKTGTRRNVAEERGKYETKKRSKPSGTQ